MAHAGMARAVSPVHTPLDGDVVVLPRDRDAPHDHLRLRGGRRRGRRGRDPGRRPQRDGGPRRAAGRHSALSADPPVASRRMPDLTAPIVNFATDQVGSYGVLAVFLLMILESACIPVPSEAIMLYGGFLVGARRGQHVLDRGRRRRRERDRLVDRLRVGYAQGPRVAAALALAARDAQAPRLRPTAGSTATGTGRCCSRAVCPSSARSSRCRRASRACPSGASRS